MLSFKPTFSLSSFALISLVILLFLKIGVMSFAYLMTQWCIFFPAILILACASFSPALHMMYSAYKLNKLGDNIQPWCTPFPIWNQSVVPCPVLTISSWWAYRFLRKQVRWSAIPITWRIFLYFVFLYFFALVTEEGFLIPPCYSLELCSQMGISFLFFFDFSFSSFLTYL